MPQSRLAMFAVITDAILPRHIFPAFLFVRRCRGHISCRSLLYEDRQSWTSASGADCFLESRTLLKMWQFNVCLWTVYLCSTYIVGSRYVWANGKGEKRGERNFPNAFTCFALSFRLRECPPNFVFPLLCLPSFLPSFLPFLQLQSPISQEGFEQFSSLRRPAVDRPLHVYVYNKQARNLY